MRSAVWRRTLPLIGKEAARARSVPPALCNTRKGRESAARCRCPRVPGRNCATRYAPVRPPTRLRSLHPSRETALTTRAPTRFASDLTRASPRLLSPSRPTQARKLETEIDGKLATLQRAVSTAGVDVSDALLAGDSLDAQTADLDALLQRLADVSTAMAGAVKGGVGDTRAHTLARHKDILAEYQHELRRAKNAVQQSRESAELLGGGRASGGLSSSDHFGDSSAGSQLMRERGTIMSGTSKVDDVIGQAQATAAALVNQREIFQNVNRNLDAIGSRFPMVNNLLQAIRRKRSKDTMVLATVVAICTAFTLIYWLSK